MSYHYGRSWPGLNLLERQCPCPLVACGLVDSETHDHGCRQHASKAMKTMRQGHDAKDCPGAIDGQSPVKYTPGQIQASEAFWGANVMAAGAPEEVTSA